MVVSYVFVRNRSENTFSEEGLGSGWLRDYLLLNIISNFCLLNIIALYFLFLYILF